MVAALVSPVAAAITVAAAMAVAGVGLRKGAAALAGPSLPQVLQARWRQHLRREQMGPPPVSRQLATAR